ncbi:aminoglycoside phosphotransferase family protein [Novosphingobium aquae]|uniref:Phosphotransferase n=1 Tax=Novosphingobium aquae TaxID=3133435 RepID=A0ABU8S7N3_9SPHN
MLPRWLSPFPVVPERWESLDADWFTKALGRDHPGARVSAARLIQSDDGTNRRARFALEYSAGSGPAQLFLKAHSPHHRWVHLRNGNLFLESRLFAGNTPLPLEHPHVYLAVPDYPRLDFLLVMEDLTLRGADPRDALRPLTPAQVASGLAGLAALHGHYWGMTARSHRGLGWIRQWAPSQGWQVGLRKRVPTGLSRSGNELPDEVRALSADRVVDLWAANVTTLVSGHQTLLHGDAHVGNTYVIPDDSTGFLDWQVVRRGNWIQDVGYFLVGALTVDDRRLHERDLLRGYLDALGLPDAQRPSWDEAWHRYRQSPAYGLAIWLSTLGTDGWQPHAISRALTERYGAAFGDHGTAALLA